MVLIGARKTADGKYYFLLQNSWPNRYFLEISAQYMSESGADIHFVNRVLTSMNLSRKQRIFADSAQIEIPQSGDHRL